MAYRWNKNWASKHTADVSGKKILVVNDFQLALKLSQNNSVTYLTDDHEDYYDFLEMVSPVNNVNFGMDDSVHLVDYKGDYTRDITSMKFDLIVGNPPYEGKGKPLYLQILAHLMPYAKEVVWICPTQWTKAWKDIPYTAELKRTTLNCLIDHENMPSPFEDAAICQGVAVYHFGEADKYEDYEDLKYEKFSNVELAKMMDEWPAENWRDPDKTMLDPTMGAGNIVIAMLYRRIVENGQDPITALKNTYGVELDPPTHRYAQQRIIKFMKNFTEEDVTEIVKKNFVNSDIFEWNLETWKSKNDKKSKFLIK